MDNLLEILIPLIFAAIYFFGNMLSKNGEEDDAPKPNRRPMTPVEDSEAMERQRRIQEEIRRKIMERRQGQGTSQEPRRESPQPQYQPVQREAQPASQPVEEIPATKVSVEKTSVDRSEGAAFSWDQSDNAYETRMQRQLKEIEATKARASKLQREAAQASERAGSTSSRRSSGQRSGRSLATGSVREVLKDPAAARAAFIYGEVLGPPVSMQKSSSVPGIR